MEGGKFLSWGAKILDFSKALGSKIADGAVVAAQKTKEGAIIAAQGASNANVKANIISAVEAVTGLATHKIQVFEMGI